MKAKDSDEMDVGLAFKIIYAEYIFPKLLNIATFLTRYFPFSEFKKEHFFHYKNRDVRETLDLMEYKSVFSKRLFKYDYLDRDKYFIYYFGKFVGRDKDKSAKLLMHRLHKKFGKNNVYLDAREKNHFQIRIPNIEKAEVN